MKCSDQPYEIDGTYEELLQRKINVFRTESKTRKAVHLTLVASNGILHNEHSGIVINEVTGEDLFR